VLPSKLLKIVKNLIDSVTSPPIAYLRLQPLRETLWADDKPGTCFTPELL